MTKRDKDERDEILALLEHVADYEQSVDEAREELAADGVNVSAFLARVQSAVDVQKKEERLSWRNEAKRNAEQFVDIQAATSIFASMSRAELEAAAAPYAAEFHYKNLKEHTDEDLRTLLEDRARLEALAKKND
jgi:predicted AAA+ superfamily ATPase